MSGDDNSLIRSSLRFGGCSSPNAVIRALDEAGFIIVRKGVHGALRRMVDTFRPFSSRPIGAPYSQARLDQEDQIAAHAEASAVAYPAGHVRE